MSTVLNTAIEPQFRTINGLRIRFAGARRWQSGAPLLSPWAESIHAFDQMWHRLAEHTHLVAVDLPGFGHSERRNSLLAPRAMGQFVIRLADEFGLSSRTPSVRTSAPAPCCSRLPTTGRRGLSHRRPASDRLGRLFGSGRGRCCPVLGRRRFNKRPPSRPALPGPPRPARRRGTPRRRRRAAARVAARTRRPER